MTEDPRPQEQGRRVVVDASAILALLNSETGADVVAKAIPGATVSAVNFSEVVAKLGDAGMPEAAIRESLEGLGLDVVDFDFHQAYATGLLRSITRTAGLPTGDRACLALAERLGLPALTADATWAAVGVGIDVRMIR